MREFGCSAVVLILAITSGDRTGVAGESAVGEAVEVDAGPQDRQGTPVFFELPQRLRTHRHFLLTRLENDTAVDVQRLPGEEYVSRYRYSIHTGQPDAEAANRLWHDYARPPLVRVVENF